MAKRLATSGGDLTDDLLTEVLLKLPIKYLLRCKSVSKSWLSLISSHRFAKSHLLLTTARNDDEILIVHLEHDEYNKIQDGSFQLFGLGYGDIIKNLEFPYSPDEYYPFVMNSSTLVGCDCGIICVSVNVSYWPAAINNTDIYLWNPATRHSKRIPPHTLLDNDDKMTYGALGFGFDHVDFDFKVVRVVRPTISSVKVYSSNKNAWRKIETNATDTSFFYDFDACLHGFLFAIGYNDMMTFDLNKEVFVCHIKLPCNYKRSGRVDFCISDFSDSVAVFRYDKLDEKVKLWTLNDETCLRGGEVEASWTLMLNIHVGVPLLFVEGLFNSVEFLLRQDNGDQLLYNSNQKWTRDVPDFPILESREVFKYTESLFSIEGFKRIKCSALSRKLQHESDLDEESIPY